MTNILETLRYVMPELNLLYTIPPFQKRDSQDGGWFCREHSFHCAVLCEMLKVNACIFLGQYFVKLGLDESRTSKISIHGEHAWCSVGDTKPVDLSMTLKYFRTEAPKVSGVFGKEKNG